MSVITTSELSYFHPTEVKNEHPTAYRRQLENEPGYR